MKDRIENLENVGVVSKNLISDGGISLTSGWYPSLVVWLCGIFRRLSPKASRPSRKQRKLLLQIGRARGIHFISHIPFVKCTWWLVHIQKCESHQGIEICAYFFPEDTPLTGKYLEYTKKFLSLYGELLAPYPYKRFSVVENILPTGYSMPTFTLLGRAVVNSLSF